MGPVLLIHDAINEYGPKLNKCDDRL